MGETKIEWTDKVWNPVTGCTKVSKGCANCYAERIFHRPYPGREFTDVRVHNERLSFPASWRKPCRVFVNSMSDLFHEGVGQHFVRLVFEVMINNPRHTYQVLTKRPKHMHWLLGNADWWAGTESGARSHIWLGVSVEDQKTADERIPPLLQTPAAVRFVSYEPALGPVDVNKYLLPARLEGHQACRGVHWVIAGGESGSKARPSHPDWFRSVRDQCQAADVPFFFKQWGEYAPIPGNDPEIAFGPRIGGMFIDFEWMGRYGKRRAGRLLDGREWNEFPEVRNYAAHS